MSEELDEKARELIAQIKALRAGTMEFNAEVANLIAVQITALVPLAPLQRQAIAETISSVLGLVLDTPKIIVTRDTAGAEKAATEMNQLEDKMRKG